MAEAAVEFLLHNLKELSFYHINQLTQGQEVVDRIEYELETLIPQLERIEATSGLSQRTKDLAGRIRDENRRAEVLAETYTKRKIQRNAATFKKPIYVVRIWRTSKQLHRIQEKINRYRNQLSQQQDSHFLPRSPSFPGPAAEEQTVPAYLLRCMHYLLLFPPNDPVPARRLIVLWVAEGLVHSKNHVDRSAEQIAQGYLDELEGRGLILKKVKRGGKLAYSIHAGKRKVLMEEAKEAGFFQVKAENADSSANNELGVRRLVDCNGSSTPPYFIQIPVEGNKTSQYKNVISFLSFNTREGSKPGEDIGDFLRKCISQGCLIWLRVLDLERVFRPKLPDTLGQLIAMKYLGLRWTYLERLPDSVDKLFNLQVLDVKHTYISVLPRSIWRMQYLQHLYLSEAYRTRFPKPPSKVTLDALQTLWGAFVDEETLVQGGFDKLFNIRKLGLSCRSRQPTPKKMEENFKAIDKWISNLEFLESLSLKSRDEGNKAADLHLTSLAGNRKLSTVYLLGKLDSGVLCTLPVSLTNITLSGSDLKLDPMGFLGRLPNLITLRLLGQSVIHSKLSCTRRGFRKLEVLWIRKLESLTDLEAEDGSLPCLEELEIRDCPNLGKLPFRLQQLKHLTSQRNMQQKIVA